MPSDQEIKQRAAELFWQRSYAEAFEALWKLGATEFAAHILNLRKRKNAPGWLVDEASREYFWTVFVHRPDVRYELFRTKYTTGLLSVYWDFGAEDDSHFLSSLAGEFPDMILELVRMDMVFMRQEWKEKLSTLRSIPRFQIHCIVWERLASLEQEYWKRVEADLPSLDEYDLHELLSDVVIWLELGRFGRNTIQQVHFLARIYSFFAEKILPRTKALKQGSIQRSVDDFFEIFTDRFLKAHREKDNYNTPVASIMNSLSHWVSFMENVVEQYCFNHQVTPVMENELLLFRTSPQECYSDLVDRARYEVVQAAYYVAGSNLGEQLEKERLLVIPKGQSNGDEEINRALSDMKLAVMCVLNDLCVREYVTASGNFDVMEILSPLITHSVNRRTRYEESLERYSGGSSTWFEVYARLGYEAVQQDIVKEPYLFSGLEEFRSQNYRAVETSSACTDALVRLFSHSPDEEFARSRYSCRYDVWNNPFLKIGDVIFCPMIFLSSNYWFYSFVQNVLLEKGRRKASSEETDQMETLLGSRFVRGRSWAVKVITKQEASLFKGNGDVDVIVEGNDMTLLIQMKRTYFRLKAKDTLLETKIIDQKAADQLCRVEKYLSAPNPVHNVSGKCRRWIVTTSLEKIQSEISGCRKIGYFELLLALDNHELQDLNALIAYVESDQHLHAICESALSEEADEGTKSAAAAFGLPIEIFEPQRYSVPVLSDNDEMSNRYREMFNTAVDKDRMGEKSEAIALLHRCTEINPSDGEAWFTLANCLADIRQFNTSIRCFEKALALLPADPFITRNYCMVLMESGNFYKGLSLLIDLSELYPLMTALKRDIAAHMYFAMQNKVLTAKQLEELVKRVSA